jgi:hypothetical protein
VCRLAREGGGEARPGPPAPAVAYRVAFGRTSAPGRRALRAGLDGSALDFLGHQVGAIVAGAGEARVDYYASRGALEAAWALVVSLSRRDD